MITFPSANSDLRCTWKRCIKPWQGKNVRTPALCNSVPVLAYYPPYTYFSNTHLTIGSNLFLSVVLAFSSQMLRIVQTSTAQRCQAGTRASRVRSHSLVDACALLESATHGTRFFRPLGPCKIHQVQLRVKARLASHAVVQLFGRLFLDLPFTFCHQYNITSTSCCVIRGLGVVTYEAREKSVVVVADLHIQRIVLATEETTVTL